MAQSPLIRINVFSDLPEEALARLERGATTVEPRSGVKLFARGDHADAVYAVMGGEGRVETGTSSGSDKHLMIEVFRVGDIFGEMGVIAAAPRSADAVTDGRVRMMRIPAPTFISAMEDIPRLGLNVSRLLAVRLNRTFTLFQDRSFDSLKVVLARQILYLAELHGRQTERGLVLGSRLRQHDLANLLGATTRSIIHILNEWRASQTVAYDSERAQLTILRPDELHKLVDKEA